MPKEILKLDNDFRTEFWASLALRYTKGLGARSCKRLMSFFGSAFNAIQQVRHWGDAGVKQNCSESLIAGSWREDAKKEWESCNKTDVDILLWRDDKYPVQLRELVDPPLFLYYRGDINLIYGPCLGIVGKRQCSAAGRRASAKISAGLADVGITVVSGMAIGIDAAAHQAAVDRQGGTIAVLGAGLDVDYPKPNLTLRKKIEKKGLIITEYPPDMPAIAEHFPIRNRLISGLSLGILVVEADPKSGSLVTARLALEQNRSVYTLPQLKPLQAGVKATDSNEIEVETHFSEGCALLLEQGAQGVRNVEEILIDLKPQLKGFLNTTDIIDNYHPPIPVNLPDLDLHPVPEPPDSQESSKLPEPDKDSTEGQILALLRTNPATVDELCQKLNIPAATINSALIILEVHRYIKRLNDLRYTLGKENA